jgi:hypothetical protein
VALPYHRHSLAVEGRVDGWKLIRKHRIRIVCIGELASTAWLAEFFRRVLGTRMVLYVHWRGNHHALRCRLVRESSWPICVRRMQWSPSVALPKRR